MAGFESWTLWLDMLNAVEESRQHYHGNGQ